MDFRSICAIKERLLCQCLAEDPASYWRELMLLLYLHDRIQSASTLSMVFLPKILLRGSRRTLAPVTSCTFALESHTRLDLQ